MEFPPPEKWKLCGTVSKRGVLGSRPQVCSHPPCRCAHYRRFAEQKRAKSAPTARFIELVQPAARRLPGLPVLLPQPSSAQGTPAKSPKSPSCEAHFDRRPVRRRVFRRRVFRRRVLRRRAQKVGKVKWAWSPIERRRLRTRESRKSKMGLEAYREKEAEDQRGRVGGGWCVC